MTSSAMIRRARAGGSPARWPNSMGLPILISIFAGRGTGLPGGGLLLLPVLATRIPRATGFTRQPAKPRPAPVQTPVRRPGALRLEAEQVARPQNLGRRLQGVPR